VTAIRRSIAAFWPLVLLVLYLATFRRAVGGPGAPGAADTCDPSSGDDIPRLERCLELQADDVGVLTGLGAAYDATGRPDRAEALYRRALAVDAHDADLHVRLGELLLRRGDARGARAEGLLALTWQPGRAAARRLAGEVPAAAESVR
jgi:tetratricopeptide (TPR) repeat protein